VLALSGVLLLAGAASVLAGLAIISRHEAGTAADLAALAAASQALSGTEVACGTAGEIARINGAALEACSLGPDGIADVTVRVTIEFGSLGFGVARAEARAGPVLLDGELRQPIGSSGGPTQPKGALVQAMAPGWCKPWSGGVTHTRPGRSVPR